MREANRHKKPPSSPLWLQCASTGGSRIDPYAPGAETYTCRERAGRHSQTLLLQQKYTFLHVLYTFKDATMHKHTQ